VLTLRQAREEGPSEGLPQGPSNVSFFLHEARDGVHTPALPFVHILSLITLACVSSYMFTVVAPDCLLMFHKRGLRTVHKW
jgi:hypothetical protein